MGTCGICSEVRKDKPKKQNKKEIKQLIDLESDLNGKNQNVIIKNINIIAPNEQKDIPKKEDGENSVLAYTLNHTKNTYMDSFISVKEIREPSGDNAKEVSFEEKIKKDYEIKIEIDKNKTKEICGFSEVENFMKKTEIQILFLENQIKKKILK
jgi:hypothetical protein